MRRIGWLGAATVATVVSFAAPLGAQTLPQLTGPVNDTAHVIDAASARELDQRIRALQATTGDVVVVATVPTFQPYGSIDEYAVKLFEQAKIGQAGKDNGVLIVVAVNDHRVRIEVGYGLEEFVTDGFSGDTIRQVMLPAFRQNDYGRGLVEGTTLVIQRIASGRGVTVQGVPAPAPRAAGGGLGFPTVLIIFIVFMVVSRLLRGSGGPRGFGPRGLGGWGGFGGFGGGFGGGSFGGGGGGFGGFGGGRSGGGGASGGW